MSAMFEQAKEIYAGLGVDVEAAFKRLDEIPVSLHCWQGDDVAGFESAGELDGGLAVTGNYPGRARNPEELRRDIETVLKLVPGKKRLNLHAIYAEKVNGAKTERNKITAENFSRWLDWAKENRLGLDFNPTYFSHPMMKDGLSLSSPDKGVRDYWVEHGIACRKIAEHFGRELENCCITNFWVPDGAKNMPYDRLAPRARLADSLDRIFAVPCDEKYNRDALESKLFGIGAESCTYGSHEFYMLYAMKNRKLICFDAGHFHPTEVISDKISSALLFTDEILLHVSRGVRWDSDHVITLDDELRNIAAEIVRHNFDKRVHIGLDYFDAPINRIAAWTVGARNMSRALLAALLEPADLISGMEKAGDVTGVFAATEEMKSLPFGAVWNEYCRRCGVPGCGWIDEVRRYEKEVLAARG